MNGNVTPEDVYYSRSERILEHWTCSIEDIAAGPALHRNEVVNYLEELSSKGKIEAKAQNQRLHYKAVL